MFIIGTFFPSLIIIDITLKNMIYVNNEYLHVGGRHQTQNLFTNGARLVTKNILYLVATNNLTLIMSGESQSILSAWEVEAFIENLETSDLEDVGSAR